MFACLFKKSILAERFVFCMRLLLGALFIIAAVFKLPHQAAFIQMVHTYGILPPEMAQLYAIMLPWVELLLGLSLVVGIFPRFSATIMALVTVSFIIANVHALSSPSGNGLCGCFGDLVPLTHTQSLAIDFVMVFMAAIVVAGRPRLFCVPKTVVTGYAVKCCGVLLAVIMLTGVVPPAVVTAGSEEEAPPSQPVEEISAGSLPVLLFFYADWCHYCQEQKPVIEELEADYAGRVSFVRVNSDDSTGLVDEWGVDGFPTIVLSFSLNTGDECARFTGFTEKQGLVEALDALHTGTCPAPADVDAGPPEPASVAVDGTHVDNIIDVSLINGTPVFLFFYSDWCHYCQEQQPVIDELEETYGESVTFIRAESSEHPDDLIEWGVTGFPSMFLVTDYGDGSYTYQEFGGFTEKDILASSLDYLLANGHLPEDVVQTGYVHHSCSVGKCYENCIVDNFEYPSLTDIERNMTDLALDCLGAEAADVFEDAYSAAKTGECIDKCANADSPREWGDCVQCGISETIGKIPGAGCVVDLWGWLGDLLEPHADCLAECAAPSSMWKDNYGHPCRDYQGQKSRCNGDVLEELGCRDCEWVITNVYVCDDGCEMTGDGAVCKGKCKEEWCDDGDDCTIDWCYKGECRHVRSDEPGCGCPESCDDGNRCTTDYCDESGTCQHTRIPGCCPDSCADSDPCTRDWCDGNGSCRHAQVPGCDHPDDNNDYSSFPEYDVLPVDDNSLIAVLNNGFADSTVAGLGWLGRTVALIDPSLQGINNYGILIIPSGGLAGLDTSDLFRERLWSYVEGGGTLISFAQQQGKEFEVLPGGEVEGFGWVEDQSCNGPGSVALAEYHPLLSGMNTTEPNVSVDGFFTRYPSDASVLLTRVKNGQAAMLLYEYGRGRVLTTTLYPDMAAALSLSSQDQKILLRDITSWAVAVNEIETYAPGTVQLNIPVTNPSAAADGAPSFNPGDLVELTVDVTNTGSLDADSVTFALYDPSFNPHNFDVSVEIPHGETRSVDISYQTGPGDEAGVWNVLYFLYGGVDFVVAGFGGDFTLGYDVASVSRFQSYITVTDPHGQEVLDTSLPLDIPPGETGSLEVSFFANPAIHLGIWNARYSVLYADGTVLMSSTHSFAVSEWAEQPEGWGYQGEEINYSVTSDRESYITGSDAVFTIHLWNNSDTERTVTVWFSFPHNYWGTHNPIYGAPGTTSPFRHRVDLHETVTIEPRQGGIPGYASFDYTVPVLSYDRLWAEVCEGDETSSDYLGRTSRGVHAVNPRIEVSASTDRYEYNLGEDIPVTFTLKNTVDAAQDVDTLISLSKTGIATMDTANVSNTLEPGDSLTQTVTLSVPPDASFGTYQIWVQPSTFGQPAGGASLLVRIAHQYSVALSLDRPDGNYAARAPMTVKVTMLNASAFDWEGDVQLDIPAIGYSDSENVSLSSGSDQVLAFDDIVLPADIGQGAYLVIFSVPAEGFEHEKRFVVPFSRLALEANQTGVDAGDVLTVDLKNTGGVDTSAHCSIYFESNPGGSVDLEPEVLAEQTTSLELPVPLSMPNGSYSIYVSCRDDNTYQRVTLNPIVEVRGSILELLLGEESYNAGDTVSVDLANTGAVPTSYECHMLLRDIYNYASYEGMLSGDLGIDGAATLDFTIPEQSASGEYYLIATCTDVGNGRTSRLRSALTINGLDTAVVSVPDREIYLTSDDVTLQSHIANAGPALQDSMLKLRVWQTVAGGGGDTVSESWVARYDLPVGWSGQAITLDDAGNIYVTGTVNDAGGKPDYLTLKYNPESVEQWASVYDGGREDIPHSVAVDADGNVYVTGESEALRPGSLTLWQDDVTTVKYNASGVQQQVARFAGAPDKNDYGEVVDIDAAGNVYVSGSMYGDYGWDYVTIKYNSSLVQQWASVYDGPGTGYSNTDRLEDMVVDADGNVYVTGTSDSEYSNSDYATLKYNTDNGSMAWAASYNGTGGVWDEAYGIAIDSAGNTYVTGASTGGLPGDPGDYDIVTVKYDAEGIQQRASRYEGPFGDDAGLAVAVDASGNVYVAGDCNTDLIYGEVPVTAFCVIKYDADLQQQWASLYENEEADVENYFAGMALDAAGNPYIAGTFMDDSWSGDYVTVKFNPSDGAVVWDMTYNGDADGDDWAAGIAVGADGSVYVTGMSEGYTGNELTTVKYVQSGSGVLQWEKNVQPLDLAAGGTQDIDTLVEIPVEFPGVTGKVYHAAELYTGSGQLVAASETQTFYIVDTGLALSMETDREFYRPGDTVHVSGELLNTAAAPDSGTLTVSKDGTPFYSVPFDLQPGESLGFATSVPAGDADFSLQAAASAATVADTIEVRPYDVDVEILAPDIVGLEPFNAVVSLENRSADDYDNVHVTLDTAAWDIALGAGEAVLLETLVTVTSDTLLTAGLTGDVVMTAEKAVTMGAGAEIEVIPDETYSPGDVVIPFTLENTGLIDISTDIVFAIDSRSREVPVFAAAGETVSDNVSFDPGPGNYTLEYQSLYGSGIETFAVTGGPEFEVTQFPDNTDLVVGDPTWDFTVKNTGDSAGWVEFYLQTPDWSGTQSAWLEAGEETVFSFEFTIPDDLEANAYTAYFELNGERYSFSFNVEGPKLSVTSSLDKELYEVGDTAVLTLDIENVSDFDLDLFASVALGDYEELVDFSLAAHDSTALNFDVPAVFDSGKLFYGIYMESGRALHLNALYIYERGPLELSTDYQVYDIGDTVNVTMKAPQAGTIDISAPGYTDNITLAAGTSTTEFTVPILLTGTYYIEYTFGGTSARYPFDVRGYSAHITSLNLDRSAYQAGDPLAVTAVAVVSLPVDVNMSCRILDEWGASTGEFDAGFSLVQGENTIESSTVFNGSTAGMYSIRCQLLADISGEPLMLASAGQYFDATGLNAVPVCNAGIPYSATEGSAVLFDAAGTYDGNNDSLQYRWDFDSDGSYDEGWSAASTASHTWNDDWTGIATLQVTDGQDTTTDTVSVDVENSPPIVSAVASPLSAGTGETVSFSGQFTDSGIEDTHTIVWDFGDGNTATGALSATHVYHSGGTFTASLTVTDDDGGSDTAVMTVAVTGSSSGYSGESAVPYEDEGEDAQDEEEETIDETPSPADFSLGGLVITTGEVHEGETFTIDVDLSNSGGTSDSYVIELEIDGVIVESRTVTLGPGESRTITFYVFAGEPGQHLVRIGELSMMFEILAMEEVESVKPSGLSVLELSAVPDKVSPGEPVFISAMVANDNGQTVTDRIVLMINGVEEDSRELTLSPGEQTPVLFTVSRDAEGTYDISLNLMADKFRVVSAAPFTPDGGAGDATPVRWGMIGIIIGAVVVVGGLSALLYSRRRD